MLRKEKEERMQMEMICMDDIVPEDHLLRKIDSAVDFTKIYDFVEDLYCADNGRPSIDPVVLFKMVLIQHLFGIPSLRRTAEEVRLNVAYRWFLGYLMNKQTPHFSTISYNFKHRFTSETIEKIFFWILEEINSAGYLSPEAVFVDGTHIKANANIKKAVKKEVPKAAKIYEKQLMNEINQDRDEHDKKPFDDSKPPETKESKVSTTDPESGVFHKGEHKKCFAYTAQTACDKHGYVMDVTVNPGNVHDSVAFDGLYDRLVQRFPEIDACVMDAGYKTPWICKKVFDSSKNKPIAILGLDFKGNVGDVRCSNSVFLLSYLLNQKSEVRLYDPYSTISDLKMELKVYDNDKNPVYNYENLVIYRNIKECVKNCSVCVFVNDHDEFKHISLDEISKQMDNTNQTIFDLFNNFSLDELSKHNFKIFKLGEFDGTI